MLLSHPLFGFLDLLYGHFSRRAVGFELIEFWRWELLGIGEFPN
jgi:hypothetical protein